MIWKVIGLAAAAGAMLVEWTAPPGYVREPGGPESYVWVGSGASQPQHKPAPRADPLADVGSTLRRAAQNVEESRWNDDKAKLVAARTLASIALEKINVALRGK